MATRDIPFAAGTPCWVDLFTSDLDRAKTFYGALFGWEFDEAGEEFGGYVSALSDGHRVAGMMRNAGDQGAPDAWTTYLSTDDIEASVAAIGQSGGQVIAPTMAVADLGSMAVVADPVGAVFGLWQPGTHIGFGKYNEPGSVTWDEQHSKDFALSTPFYEAVFGWHLNRSNDTDDFRYYEAQVDGHTVAGLMDSARMLPSEIPSHWAVYFSVEDVDAAVATAIEQGAAIGRSAEDTPFGRIADLSDPTGAPFKLHSDKLANAEATG